MQAHATRSLVREVTGHLAMGAVLGLFLALVLLVSNARNIFEMIVHSSAPWLMMAIFVIVFTTYFAVGATLTGFIIVRAQDESLDG